MSQDRYENLSSDDDCSLLISSSEDSEDEDDHIMQRYHCVANCEKTSTI